MFTHFDTMPACDGTAIANTVHSSANMVPLCSDHQHNVHVASHILNNSSRLFIYLTDMTSATASISTLYRTHLHWQAFTAFRAKWPHTAYATLQLE